MIYTTLNRIRARRPCARGWEKLLRHLGKTAADDEPLALATVLHSNGLDDALWCCRAEPQHAALARLYAVRRAESARHLMTDPRSLDALDVARRYALGEATYDELAAARAAALAAALAAVPDAAWAAARAAAWAAATLDFAALLAAHEAAPGKTCPVSDKWLAQHFAIDKEVT